MTQCELCGEDGGDVYWENDGIIEGYYCEHCANHLRARYDSRNNESAPEPRPCELCDLTHEVRSSRDPRSGRIGSICKRCAALWKE